MQVICLIILLLVQNVQLALGKSDLDALLELKKGIQKDPSEKVLVSWDSKSLASNGCPQNWFGISCSNGHVTSIILNDIGLVGDFDFSTIAELKLLQNLSVSNNQFTGTITNDVGSLESLEILDLSSNLFHGSIPSQLTDLKNLVFLNISLNNLEGTISSGFGSLEQLQYLDLRSNGFSGDAMLLLSQLGSVVHVDLSGNKFIGSLDLGLANSSFISAIQYLNISHNTLAGELFSHDGMPYFDNLDVFDASNNLFVGTVPSFNFIVSLRILRLGSNQLNGSLPEALVKESSMILSDLDLSFNQLEGPVGVISSATLKNLNLSSNKLSGPLPIKVGRCAVIDLSNNMLSGNLSRILDWGNYVEIIDLSSNSLTGPFPNLTSQFLRLRSLKISNNSIEGVLPLVLGAYPELQNVDFSLNRQSGFLLPDFFVSMRLAYLNLSYNNFTGPIPLQNSSSSPFSLSLVSLDLSHNSLTGDLPPEIGKFPNMVYLDLSNNHFEGGIPDDLPNELKGLNVSYNNLSGVVPENLRRFPDSAFHPGNSFLVFPFPPSPPRDFPNVNLRGKGSRMKSSIKAALIVGLVGGASTIAIMIILIYYRAHLEINRRNFLRRNSEMKDIQQGVSSFPPESSLQKNADPSVISHNSNPENFLSLGMASTHGDRDISSKEPRSKNEELDNPSPSENENSASLKVYSPDKLAGDLHLFDGSLAFTAEELSLAPAEIIGRSCHGMSYKAVLDSGHVLAVKWLKGGIAKGKKEFAREAKKLGNIKHPNLVSLRGYYWGPKDHEKLIITSYVDAPCLALYLQGTDRTQLQPLSLDQRLKIAVDVARCLNYLHNERAIPHGNLKSTNILIETPNLNTLLTDYSLHRIMTSAGTAEQVLNSGTLGYRPPEFASTSKPCPSLMSDVYAFGVILLELLTGKSSSEIVSGSTGVVELTEWVRLLSLENRSIECFDRLILGSRNSEGPPGVLDDLLRVALRCIRPASERPDMKTIFEDLSSIVLEEASAR